MEGNSDSPPCVLDTGEPSLRSPCRYDGCVTVLGGRPVNTVELSTLTYQIVGRQPFAAETNHVPSRHRDADLPLNSIGRKGAIAACRELRRMATHAAEYGGVPPIPPLSCH